MLASKDAIIYMQFTDIIALCMFLCSVTYLFARTCIMTMSLLGERRSVTLLVAVLGFGIAIPPVSLAILKRLENSEKQIKSRLSRFHFEVLIQVFAIQTLGIVVSVPDRTPNGIVYILVLVWFIVPTSLCVSLLWMKLYPRLPSKR